jgi:hypothetical protein
LYTCVNNAEANKTSKNDEDEEEEEEDEEYEWAVMKEILVKDLT